MQNAGPQTLNAPRNQYIVIFDDAIWWGKRELSVSSSGYEAHKTNTADITPVLRRISAWSLWSAAWSQMMKKTEVSGCGRRQYGWSGEAKWALNQYVVDQKTESYGQQPNACFAHVSQPAWEDIAIPGDRNTPEDWCFWIHPQQQSDLRRRTSNCSLYRWIWKVDTKAKIKHCSRCINTQGRTGMLQICSACSEWRPERQLLPSVRVHLVGIHTDC